MTATATAMSDTELLDVLGHDFTKDRYLAERTANRRGKYVREIRDKTVSLCDQGVAVSRMAEFLGVNRKMILGWCERVGVKVSQRSKRFDFWDFVDKSGECWLWTGYLHPRCGYGCYTVNGKTWMAHRYAYFLTTGVDPGKLQVCHHCDNPPCVRPDHMFLGTMGENLADCILKGRISQGERCHQAKLTDSKVIEMRQSFKAGDKNIRALAREYGVSESSAKDAIRGITYKYLPGVSPVPANRKRAAFKSTEIATLRLQLNPAYSPRGVLLVRRTGKQSGWERVMSLANEGLSTVFITSAGNAYTGEDLRECDIITGSISPEWELLKHDDVQ